MDDPARQGPRRRPRISLARRRERGVDGHPTLRTKLPKEPLAPRWSHPDRSQLHSILGSRSPTLMWLVPRPGRCGTVAAPRSPSTLPRAISAARRNGRRFASALTPIPRVVCANLRASPVCRWALPHTIRRAEHAPSPDSARVLARTASRPRRRARSACACGLVCLPGCARTPPRRRGQASSGCRGLPLPRAASAPSSSRAGPA